MAATDTAKKDDKGTKARLKSFPDKSGKDIPLRAKVHQPDGEKLSGVVDYRVADGRDGRPRIGIKVEHKKGQSVLSRGRKVEHIVVDANSLVIDELPQDGAGPTKE